jgi:hypothetical protein
MSIDIMRLQSVNLRKTLKLSVLPNKDETLLDLRSRDPPSLKDARLALMFHLEGLFWRHDKKDQKFQWKPRYFELICPNDNRAEGKAAAIEIMKRRWIEPYQENEVLCMQCLGELENMPIPIPLRGINTDPDPPEIRKEELKRYSYQRLLLYEDEFEVMKEF